MDLESGLYIVSNQIFHPKQLIPKRAEAFLEDLEGKIFRESLLEGMNSFQDFVELWKESDLNELHSSKLEKEDKTEFYQTLYGVIINNFLTSKSILFQSGAVFALYIIHYTQPLPQEKGDSDDRVLINVDMATVEIIEKLLDFSKSEKKEDLFSILQKMIKDKVFSYGCLVGVKTLLVNKLGEPRKNNFEELVRETINSKPLKKIEKKRTEAKLKASEKFRGISKLHEKYTQKVKKLLNEMKKVDDKATLHSLLQIWNPGDEYLMSLKEQEYKQGIDEQS